MRREGLAYAHSIGEGPLRPGLRIETNLDGQAMEYICACGFVFWPTDWATDCSNYLAGSDRCIQPFDKSHHRKPSRVKYRKVSGEQATMSGLGVNKAFWGVEERMMEDPLTIASTQDDEPEETQGCDPDYKEKRGWMICRKGCYPQPCRYALNETD